MRPLQATTGDLRRWGVRRCHASSSTMLRGAGRGPAQRGCDTAAEPGPPGTRGSSCGSRRCPRALHVTLLRW
eukprot:1414797-Alexandrium_andersonii.AAC.1